jgi:hypothetical protein
VVPSPRSRPRCRATDRAPHERGRFLPLLDDPQEPDPPALAEILVDLAELELELEAPEAALTSARRALELFAHFETEGSNPERAREVIAALDVSRGRP